jgi:hypothetical protein
MNCLHPLIDKFNQNLVCRHPSGIQANRTDGSTSELVAHISKELGFWCINAEQETEVCADFQVRFCCPKWSDGSDCSDEGYGWTQWKNLDTPSDSGDWETITFLGEADVCSKPIGVEGRAFDLYGMGFIEGSSGGWPRIS